MTTIRELSKYPKNVCERRTLESAEKSASSPQVPWVPKCLKCMTALSASSALSGLSPRVSWVPECSSGYRMLMECLQSAQIGQNFGSLFVLMNKSVKNAELTEWFSCQNCWIKIVHKQMTYIETIENSMESEW